MLKWVFLGCLSTLLGHHNPDWTVVYKEGSVKHEYFIADTKGSMRGVKLREIEESKIECARRHFAALSNSTVKCDVLTTCDDLFNVVGKF